MKMNQKGIAYLLVLILGGIIITSSIVYYSSTLIESRVSTNSRLAKQVFYHAEGGIYNVTNRIADNSILIDPESPSVINNITKVPRISGSNNTEDDWLYANTTFIPGSAFFESEYDSNKTYNLTNRDGTIRTISVYNQYLTIPYNATSEGHLSRNLKNVLKRMVSTKLQIEFLREEHRDPGFPGAPGGPGFNGTNDTYILNPRTFGGFNYGISVGGQLTFSGSTVVRNGGVFSNTNVNLGNAKNQLRITGGEAYSARTISGVGRIIPRSGKDEKYPNQSPLMFPSIDFNFYSDIADLTLGTGSDTITWNSFASLPSVNPANKPPNDVAVVYINGNLKITGTFNNTQKILLVVKGTVDTTGNADIGSPTIPFGVIAGGDINRSTGNSAVYGYYYTPGKIDMKGTFDLVGAVAAAQGINLTGNVDITYNQALSQSLPLYIAPLPGDYTIIPGTPSIPAGVSIPPIPPSINETSWTITSIEIMPESWKQEIP